MIEFHIEDLWGLDFQVAGTNILAMQWTISGFVDQTKRTRSCYGLSFLGGPGLQHPTGFMERTYIGFGTHDIIYYSIIIAMGGTWQPSDTFTLELDSNVVQVFSLSWAFSNYGTKTCDNFNSQVFSERLVGKKFHEDSSLTVRISWNTVGNGSPLPFLAIKEPNFSFATKTNSDVEEIYISLPDTTNPLSTGCVEGQYKKIESSGSSCQGCDSKCGACFGPNDNQCYFTNWGKSYDGNNVISCTSGCGSCSKTGASNCFHCDEPKILTTDGRCVNTCTPPSVTFTAGTALACIVPCSSNQFMSWNNTCLNSCDPPLVVTSSSQGQECTYPCDQSVNSFLYWDGSCLSNCPYYQRNDNNHRFCDICQLGYYLYDDNVCRATCNPRFNNIINAATNLCSNPCHKDQYLYPDGSCTSECLTWSIEKMEAGALYCNTQRTKQQITRSELEAEAKEIKSISATQQVLGGVTAACSSIISAVNFANPAAILLAIMTRMLNNFRYLKINYPPKLQGILDSDDEFKISLIPNMPLNWVAKFPNSTLPENFEKYDFPSSFCVNFWNDEVVLSFLIIILTIVYFLARAFRSCRFIYLCSSKIENALKWNFTISLLISYFGDVVLFSSFEFRTNDFKDKYRIISFAICVFVNLVIISMLVKMVLVIRATRSITNSVVPISNPHHINTNNTKNKNYNVLLENFKSESFLQQGFLLISSMRVYIFYAIIAYPTNYPLVQISLITALNIAMGLYIILKRPMRHKLELAEYIFQEGIVLIANSCVLALAIMDQVNFNVLHTRTVLGDVIIWINTSFYSAASGYLGLKIIFKGLLAIKRAIKKPNLIKPAPLPLDNNTDNSIPPRNIPISSHLDNNHVFNFSELQTNTQMEILNSRSHIHINDIQLQPNLSMDMTNQSISFANTGSLNLSPLKTVTHHNSILLQTTYQDEGRSLRRSLPPKDPNRKLILDNIRAMNDPGLQPESQSDQAWYGEKTKSRSRGTRK